MYAWNRSCVPLQAIYNTSMSVLVDVVAAVAVDDILIWVFSIHSHICMQTIQSKNITTTCFFFPFCCTANGKWVKKEAHHVYWVNNSLSLSRLYHSNEFKVRAAFSHLRDTKRIICIHQTVKCGFMWQLSETFGLIGIIREADIFAHSNFHT